MTAEATVDRPRVLLVDDEPRVLQSIKRVAAPHQNENARLRDQAAHYQNDTTRRGHALSLGGRILKILTDFDVLECQGQSSFAALQILERRSGWYDPELLQRFGESINQSGSGLTARAMLLSDVQIGMVFGESVSTQAGVLLLARGQDVTAGLLARIQGSWSELAKTRTVRMICVDESQVGNITL